MSEKRRTQRALPARWTDLITYGVPDLGDTFDRAYDVKVAKALNSTALSALQAGHDYAEWTYRLDEHRSALGRQARRVGNRRTRSERSYWGLLLNTWRRAEAYVAEHPAPTEQEVADVIAAMRDHAADADARLTDEQRAMLTAVCDLADKHGTTRPAVPLHEAAARAGITAETEQKARERAFAVLRSLCRRGVLTRERRGNARGGLAALYRLHPPTGATAGTYHRG